MTEIDSKLIKKHQDLLNNPEKYHATGLDMWRARKELRAMGLDDSDYSDSNSRTSDR